MPFGHFVNFPLVEWINCILSYRPDYWSKHKTLVHLAPYFLRHWRLIGRGNCLSWCHILFLLIKLQRRRNFDISQRIFDFRDRNRRETLILITCYRDVLFSLFCRYRPFFCGYETFMPWTFRATVLPFQINEPNRLWTCEINWFLLPAETNLLWRNVKCSFRKTNRRYIISLQRPKKKKIISARRRRSFY